MQVSGHDVTPEIRLPVFSIAAEAKQQELAAGGDDGGYPVSVRAALIGHFKLHPRLEATL